jgi:hypothetical protein
MKKSNKIIILTGMILLLAVTAVFNFILTQNEADAGDSVTTSNYFTQYKSERLTNRNEQLLQLDSIISSESSDTETVSEALAQKLLITENMEKELMLENYIKAKGFEDAVVAIGTDSGNINVFVKDEELTAAVQSGRLKASTSGRSNPSRSRLMPTTTSYTPRRRSRRISELVKVCKSLCI